jgi:capsular polysaccharide export protein
MRLHLEDGFLRSVGLGADLVRPVSWVVDRRGIYFDATRPSDLEVMLQGGDFAATLLERAARLRERIVGVSLTKYNLAGRSWKRPFTARQVVLVPGQVESDASLRWGSPVLRSNLALLQAVRRSCPRAWIVYKPHPDVAAGLRARGSQEDEAARWCDEIAADVAIDQLLGQVDEVHTMTSLTGFEALLRGVSVTCWGQPFYAGWGLTRDRHPPLRRSRRLLLDELVAGALLLYPRYARRACGQPCTAEEAVDELLDWRRAQGGRPSLLQRVLRPVLGWRKP